MSTTAIETQTLEVPGATLTYDVRGDLSQGVPLLMVGSPMGAAGFASLASYFTDRPVVTYDPRGVERSVKADPGTESTPEQHGADLHHVIEALGVGPVDLFGSSGGAVNSLALVTAPPEQVRTLVAHEPPLTEMVPDSEQARAAVDAIHDAYQRNGFGLGMAKFIAIVSHQGLIDEAYADQPDPDPGMFGMPTDDDGSRDDVLLGQNLRTCTGYHVDVEALEGRADPHRDRGRRGVRGSARPSWRRGNRRAPGSEPVIFPGNHGGFLGGSTARPVTPKGSPRRSGRCSRRADVSDEQSAREQELTDRVVASFDRAAEPRLKELTAGPDPAPARVRARGSAHRGGVAGTRSGSSPHVGHITDDRRQEFILLSDVLGASMQTITINNEAYGERDRGHRLRTVLRRGFAQTSDSVATSPPSARRTVLGRGHVTDTDGKPRPRSADRGVGGRRSDGFYDVQYDDERTAARGHLTSDDEGRYTSGRSRRRRTRSRTTARSVGCSGRDRSISDAGVAPALHGQRADGFRTLVTHIFVSGDELLDRDSVFGVRDSLVKDFEHQAVGSPTPDGRDVQGREWSRVRFDVVLAPA